MQRQIIEEITISSKKSYPWERVTHFLGGKKEEMPPLSPSIILVNLLLGQVNEAALVEADRQEYVNYINNLNDIGHEFLRLRDETILANPAPIALDDVDDETLIMIASEFSPFQRVIALKAKQLLALSEAIDRALAAIQEATEIKLSGLEHKQLLLKKAELEVLQNEVIAAMQKYLELEKSNEMFAQQGLLHHFIHTIDTCLAPIRETKSANTMVGHFEDFAKGVPLRLINGHIKNVPQDSPMGNSLLMDEFVLGEGETTTERFTRYIREHSPEREEEKANDDFIEIEPEGPLQFFQDFYHRFIQQNNLLSLFADKEVSKTVLKEICVVLDEKINLQSAETEAEADLKQAGIRAEEDLKRLNKDEKEKEASPIISLNDLDKEAKQNIRKAQKDISEMGANIHTYTNALSYVKTRKRYDKFIKGGEIDALTESMDISSKKQWEKRRLFANISSGAIKRINDEIEIALKKLEELIKFIKASKPRLETQEKQLIIHLEQLIYEKREQICALMLERVMLSQKQHHDDVIYDTLAQAKLMGCTNKRFYENASGGVYQPLSAFSITEEEKLEFIEYIRLYGTQSQRMELNACYAGKLPSKNGTCTTYFPDLNSSFGLMECTESLIPPSLLASTDFTHVVIEKEKEDKGKGKEKDENVAPSLLNSASFESIESQSLIDSFIEIGHPDRTPISFKAFNDAIKEKTDSVNIELPLQDTKLKELQTLFSRHQAERYFQGEGLFADESLDQKVSSIVEGVRDDIDLIISIATELRAYLKQRESEEFDHYFYSKVFFYLSQPENTAGIEKAIRDTLVSQITKSWSSPQDAHELDQFVGETIELTAGMPIENIAKSIENAKAFLQTKHDLQAWIAKELDRISDYSNKHGFYNLFMSKKTTELKLTALNDLNLKLENINTTKDLTAFIEKMENDEILAKNRDVFGVFKPPCCKTAQIKKEWLQFINDSETDIRACLRSAKTGK